MTYVKIKIVDDRHRIWTKKENNPFFRWSKVLDTDSEEEFYTKLKLIK